MPDGNEEEEIEKIDEDEEDWGMINPLASYFVQGSGNDLDTYGAVIELYGETGDRFRVTYRHSESVEALISMLQSAAYDLNYAELNGIVALADKIGHSTDDTKLTVDDILKQKPKGSDQ
jgi:hypothetical protein